MNFKPMLSRALFATLAFGYLLMRPGAVQAFTTPEISLATMTELMHNIERAQTIEISAWVLSSHGRMVRALEEAARRGADLHVTLSGAGNVRSSNRKTAFALQALNVPVRIGTRPFHAKIAIIDGNLYLTDRNWVSRGNRELILRDNNADDRRIAHEALQEISESNARFSTRKRDALQLEAAVIHSCGVANVDVETEAFSRGTVVERALVDQARYGRRVRLLVDEQEYRRSPREQRELQWLSQIGVRTRVGRSAEKLAVCGSRAWMGSSNTTPGVPQQIDWGMQITPGLAPAIQFEFERNWDASYVAASATVAFPKAASKAQKRGYRVIIT